MTDLYLVHIIHGGSVVRVHNTWRICTYSPQYMADLYLVHIIHGGAVVRVHNTWWISMYSTQCMADLYLEYTIHGGSVLSAPKQRFAMYCVLYVQIQHVLCTLSTDPPCIVYSMY